MMQAAELAVLDWLQAHLRCDFLDAVMPWISRICDHGEIWILLAAVLLLLWKHRWTGMSLSFALILDLICCNIVLKPLVGRVRPFLVNTAVELLTAPPADASFPSGHTAASFAAVFALRASGSSMVDAQIDDGDLVIIRQQHTAQVGEIVVALTDEDKNTLKRLLYDDDRQSYYLHPENKDMEDIYVSGLRVQGVATHVIKAL